MTLTPHLQKHPTPLGYTSPSWLPIPINQAVTTIMESLPAHAFDIHGGCFCKAVTYTVSVPALESRPFTRDPPVRPYGPQTETLKRLPIIALDHCNSCRRIAGSILECWFICPHSWTQFFLLLRSSSHPTSGALASSGQARQVKPSTQEVLTPDKDLEHETYLKGFQSSEGANRTFCGRCGTNLTFYWSGEDDPPDGWGPHFDVAVGTLEKESVEMQGMRPGRESWWKDGIPWVQEMIGE